MTTQPFTLIRRLTAGCSLLAVLLGGNSAARASVAYGSINNFDTVNDTGTNCHGFEIELEDTHSTDISYTFDWNHYGTPNITEDNSDPIHPRCHIRWAAKFDPTNGTWSAYTAVPSGPIAPTDGHMFTDPSVNFGGEHFGVGYMNNPTVIRYNWLLDDGTGSLALGPPVQVATPTFVYYPPVVAQPGIPALPPRVQAGIAPPAPPAIPPGPQKEFGDPVWMKEIRTTSHSSHEVKLRDLVSDDPNDAHDKNWRNGEPDEVEVEWRMMQTEFSRTNGGANGELLGAMENLGNTNEVVTRRYEFYKYTGPIDPQSGEVRTDNVGPDGIHGRGTYSNTVVVGDYLGAQMSAVAVDAKLGLIDHLNDGETGTPYTARTVVIGGALPFTATNSGALPAGMTFDPVTGILSGTPTAAGVFNYTIGANDGVTAVVKTYSLVIAAAGAWLPAQHTVEVSAAPANAGTASGGGVFNHGDIVTVSAVASNGFAFLNWTDNGNVASSDENYSFTLVVNRALTANFFAGNVIRGSASPAQGGTISGGGGFPFGVNTNVTLTATANAGYVFVNWTENGVVVSTNTSYSTTSATNHALVAHFQGTVPVNASVDVPGGGTVTGGGLYGLGETVTLTATANPGYAFWGWTDSIGDLIGFDFTYTLIVEGETNVVANFYPTANLTITAQPANGGTFYGDGLYWLGDTAYIEAIPNPGFTFVNWTTNGVEFSASTTNFITLDADTVMVAHFAAEQEDHHATGLDFDGHHSHVHFVGTPGNSYVVQRSTDLVNWTDIRTNTAPVGGAFSDDDGFEDRGGVAPPAAYYRVVKR